MPATVKVPIGPVGIIFLCWAASSLSQLDKYLSSGCVALGLAIAFGGIVVGFLALGALEAKRRDVPPWSLGALSLLIVAAILVLYPISTRHAAGAGGDREDAIRVEIAAILHHRPPYTARTFHGNPATPMPGALLLASPFYAIGKIYLQNVLWVVLFTASVAAVFRRRATAFFLVLVFLLVSPGDLDDLAVGGDFFVNLLYVLIALFSITAAHTQLKPRWVKLLALVFLGVALSSRPIYIVTLPLVFSLVLQRAGQAAAWRALLLVCAVTAVITLPFYVHDIHQLVPAHLAGRANLLLPAWLHPSFVLPAAGILVALSGVRVRMDFDAVLLLLGLAMAVMLLPPLLPALLVPIFGYPPGTNIGVLDLEYLAPAALPLALWTMRRYEVAIASQEAGSDH